MRSLGVRLSACVGTAARRHNNNDVIALSPAATRAASTTVIAINIIGKKEF